MADFDRDDEEEGMFSGETNTETEQRAGINPDAVMDVHTPDIQSMPAPTTGGVSCPQSPALQSNILRARRSGQGLPVGYRHARHQDLMRSASVESLPEQDYIMIQKPENLMEARRLTNNHMFGFKKWKSHVTVRPIEDRSEIVKELYSETEKIHIQVSTCRPGNIIYVMLFGWWVALIYLILAIIMGITVVGRKYSTFCFKLATYFFWPFGKFVFRNDPRKIEQLKCALEETHPVVNIMNNRRQSLTQSHPLPSESSSLLVASYSQDNWWHKETKFWKRPESILWLLLACPLLLLVHGLVFFISWLSVIFIPVAKVNGKAIRKLLLLPPELLCIDKSSYNAEQSRSDIVVYTYQAVNVYYYKYTVDGMNVIAVNLLLFVIFALLFGYLDKGNKITSSTTKFVLSLLAVIPLAYYIGMGITSVSAQSSFAVGAVLNASFGSVVEISLYIMALINGARGSDKNVKCFVELVKSSLVGTLLATMMLIPGLCMIIGGLRHQTQVFNPRSVGVSSTLLFVSVAGVFAPTIFSKAYGTLHCNHCVNSTDNSTGANSTWDLQCGECEYSVFGINGDKTLYEDNIRPIVYTCAIILPISYIVGLFYSLKTHRAHIHDTFAGEIEDAPEGHRGHGHSTAHWGRLKSLAILLVSTVLISLCADIITDNIRPILTTSGVSVYFIGVTLLALIPDIPEMVTGIQFALQNNICLSIEVGSCIATQVCMLQIPILVLANVIHDLNFYLLFSDIHLCAVVFAVLMMNYVFQDGKSDYFQGSALCLVYVAMMALYLFAPAPKDAVCDAE